MDDKKVLETKAIVDDSDFKKKMSEMSGGLKEFANQMSSGFNKVGEQIQKGTNRIKWFGFALFGVYSMYHFLAKASLAYLAQDTETTNKIKAAWIGLGAMFAPLLEKIADFAIKAVKYLNVFITALTGVDLLARAQEKSFNKAAKGVNNYKRALSGIDEITNLDTKTGGASDAEDFNWLDEFGKVELDTKWVKFFEDLGKAMSKIDWVKLGKEILNWAMVIGGLWGMLQLAKLINGFQTITSAIGGLITKLGGLSKALSFGVILIGIMITLEGIVAFIKDPSWDNFLTILGGISVIVAGIAMVMGGWVVALGGIAVATAALVGKLLLQNTTTANLKKTTQELVRVEERLRDLKDELSDATDRYTSAVDRANVAKERLLEIEKEHKVSGEEMYNLIQTQGVAAYDTMTQAQRDAYLAYKDLIEAEKDKQEALEDTMRLQEEEIRLEEEREEQKQRLIELAKKSTKAIKLEGEELETYKNTIVEAYEKGELSVEEARDAIEKAMGNMSKASRKTFAQDLPNDIKENLDPDKYRSWGKRLGDWFSNLWNGIFGKKKVEIDIATTSSGGNSRGYALGLQEVPHDMYTLVHKGEAIVPARFNKDGYFNGGQVISDNSEVVYKLNELIEIIRDKDNVVIIGQDTIGQASVDYINQQSRLLGRGLI